MRKRGLLLAPTAALAFASLVSAQTKATPLAVGATAPNFALAGATMDGLLPKAAQLTDFRGQTVVLAFFYKARTGG